MSASQQYLRQLSVVVAKADGEGLEFQDFRCVFQIRRGDYQTPNSCDVRIWNLSTHTQNTIAQKEFTTLSISAGYQGSFGLIFQGSIKQFRKGRVDQKDSYVDITAADGDEAFNFAPVFQSASAGTEPSAIARLLLQAFQGHGFNQQITAGYQPNFSQNGCIRGRVFYGMARDELRDFAWAQNCKWSIQDGALTFIPFTSYIPSSQVPVISPSSGLIGVPEQTQQGVKVRVLLNPNMKVGQTIKIEDTTINQLRFGLSADKATQINNSNANAFLNTTNASGLYYVMVANHTGDSRGNDWYTDMVCLAVDATIPPDSAPDALFSLGAQSIPRY
jgi:hypothetical protein